ncbi:MAG: endonuclease III [Patescibacteria group bacterium]
MQNEFPMYILKALKDQYPNAHTELNYKTPLELMIAVMLSAQATDVGVTKATPALFAKFKTVHDFANADIANIEKYISSINYYKAKASYIKRACQKLIADFGGKVPDSLEKLVTVPGIGRKSANVILINAFNKAEGVVVDTHVSRVSQKLHLTSKKDPIKIEQDLMKIYPKENWADVSHLFVLHGRYTCKALTPKCNACPISNFCPSKQ